MALAGATSTGLKNQKSEPSLPIQKLRQMSIGGSNLELNRRNVSRGMDSGDVRNSSAEINNSEEHSKQKSSTFKAARPKSLKALSKSMLGKKADNGSGSTINLDADEESISAGPQLAIAIPETQRASKIISHLDGNGSGAISLKNLSLSLTRKKRTFQPLLTHF
jgi:hypothetical protein